MKTITLRFLQHRGRNNIAMEFAADQSLTAKLRKQLPLRWSKHHRCWYCMFTAPHLTALKTIVNGSGYDADFSVFKGIEIPKPVAVIQSKLESMPAISRPPVVQLKSQRLSVHNACELDKVSRELSLKYYSASTVRTYTNELAQFFKMLGKTDADSLSPDRLKDYFRYCHDVLKQSEAVLHSRINAMKFYYEQLLGREKFFISIPRPKKYAPLPKVLSERELGRMFNAVKNIKHKAILFTAYSAGLRVSEVVHLKLCDVDPDRMQLFIENSKGKKDRYVGLSMVLLDVLRSYIGSMQPRPRRYLFENPQQPGDPYSIRGAQKIFSEAKRAALISKEVGIHSLRHSFATHLLEKGIDIRYIKDLLGHFNIKTTERYLHVTKETLFNIPNLLDELNKAVDLEW